MTGVCKFCGQIQNTSQSFLTQELCDEYVTKTCLCKEAKREVQRSNAKLKIGLLFVDYDEEIIPFLLSLADSVIDHRSLKISVSLVNGVRCNIKMDGDDNIIIERIVTEKKKEIATQKYVK